MITAVSSGFALMAESAAQRPAQIRISLSLPGGVYPDVSLAVVDCDTEFTSTTASAVTVTPGTPSATARFTLAGQIDPADPARTVAWLFRRWNRASPLWRIDALQTRVTIDVGFNLDGTYGVAELVRQFTGYIDSYSCSADGTVQFECIDLWTRLRALPETGAIVDNPILPIYLTSEFLVDYVMRQVSSGAIASSPPPRPNCQISATMRGSLYPEVGRFGASSAFGAPAYPGHVSFAAGPNGSHAVGDGSGVAALPYRAAQPLSASLSSATLYVEQGFVVAAGSLAGSWEYDTFTPTGGNGFRITVNSPNSDGTGASVTLAIIPAGAGATAATVTLPTITAGNHLLEVFVTLTKGSPNATYAATVRWDGSSQTTGTKTASAPMTSLGFDDTFTIVTSFGVENFQVANPPVMPPTNWGFVPTATLDASLNSMTVIPKIAAGTGAQTLVQQAGDAELAEGWFDESEHFYWRNRATLAVLSPARTIASESSLSGLDEESVSAAVVNRAQVGFTTWQFGSLGLVWNATAVWSVPAHGTLVRDVTLTSLVTINNDVGSPDMFPLPNGVSPNSGSHYFRASRDKAGANESFDVTGNVEQVAADRLRLTFVNTGGYRAYLVSPFGYTDLTVGTPAIWVGGVAATASNEAIVDYQFPDSTTVGANGLTGAAGTRWGEQPWTSTGNPLRQDPDLAADLAEFVVNSAHVARPVLSNIAVQLDPRLQILDWVRLYDPDTTYVDDYVQILGKRLTFSAGQFGMSLDAQCGSAPGGWLLGITGRSEIADDPAVSTAYVYAE